MSASSAALAVNTSASQSSSTRLISSRASGLIVDHQHLDAGQVRALELQDGSPQPAGMEAFLDVRVPVDDHERKLNGECRAAALARARDPHRAAVELDQLLHDGQSEAEALTVARREASACRKRSNTCGRNSGLMPMPVSATVISMCEFTRSSRTCDLSVFPVNLMALESRFQTTCCSRFGSPEIGPAAGSRSF